MPWPVFVAVTAGPKTSTRNPSPRSFSRALFALIGPGSTTNAGPFDGSWLALAAAWARFFKLL
jgi:hypothetical protein